MRKLLIIATMLVSLSAACQADTLVYDVVEQMPQFPGGDDSMRHFLLYNLEYPEHAKRHNLEGRVDVRFVVDENGDISHVVAERGLIPELNIEAVRVVKSFPRFIPGVHDGRPVRVIVVQPIIFLLADQVEKRRKKGK